MMEEINTQDYERPEVLEGRTIGLKTPCGGFYLTLNEDGNNLREIRMTLGKPGTCQRLLFETIAILLSVLLQSKIPREKIKKALYHQFEGNCGNNKSWHEGEEYHSCINFTITKIFEDMASRGEISFEDDKVVNELS